MGLLDDVKEIADLVRESQNVELYRKTVELERNVIELEQRNKELEALLKLKKKMEFKEPVYYMVGDQVPYCPKCWETENKAIHLVKNNETYNCYNCKMYYRLMPTW